MINKNRTNNDWETRRHRPNKERMAVTLNAKGTSIPYFTVGKNGVTLYQGTTDPSYMYAINPGDFWFNTSINSLNIWSLTSEIWEAPRLADITFAQSIISAGSGSDLTLKTTAGKNIVIDSVGPAVLSTKSGSLTINPALSGGTNLILNANTWPAADGVAGQTLVTDGLGNLAFSPISAGLQLYKEYPESPVAPEATGVNSVAVGSNSSSTGVGSFAQGDGSNASIYGQRAFANGNFSSPGDAQHGVYVLRNITTNSAVTEMFLDGPSGTQTLVIPNNSVVTFSIIVAARRTDAVNGGAGYRFDGVIMKDDTSDSISFIGIPSKTILGETNMAWDAVISANTISGYLQINVIGETGKTIRWVATVLTTETTN